VTRVDERKVKNQSRHPTRFSENVNPHAAIICAGVANYCMLSVLKCVSVQVSVLTCCMTGKVGEFGLAEV